MQRLYGVLDGIDKRILHYTTENTPLNEIEWFLDYVWSMQQYSPYYSEADKKAMMEDLDKIQTLTEYNDYFNICYLYLVAEAYDKAVKACEKDLESGKIPSSLHGIHQAYIATKQYQKAINSLEKTINESEEKYQWEKSCLYLNFPFDKTR